MEFFKDVLDMLSKSSHLAVKHGRCGFVAWVAEQPNPLSYYQNSIY
jgi:hypothetical protein